MIVDSLANVGWYFKADWWRKVVEFIRTAHPALPDGEHALQGREVFVRILSLKTGPCEHTVLESHRSYVDIHVVLDGQETIEVWPTHLLTPRNGYDSERDVTFYMAPDGPPAVIDLRPGNFAVFFPQDAHMPQLVCEVPCQLKKLVVKTSVELVRANQARDENCLGSTEQDVRARGEGRT